MKGISPWNVTAAISSVIALNPFEIRYANKVDLPEPEIPAKITPESFIIAALPWTGNMKRWCNIAPIADPSRNNLIAFSSAPSIGSTIISLPSETRYFATFRALSNNCPGNTSKHTPLKEETLKLSGTEPIRIVTSGLPDVTCISGHSISEAIFNPKAEYE